MPLHLYGVVRPDAPVPDRYGVGDPPGRLRLVTAEGIAAVVSEVTGGPLTDHDAVTHLDVLAALSAVTGVLPLRFGTEAPDETAVREEVLAAAAPDLEARLTALEHDVELRIDLDFDEEHALRELLRVRPELAGGARGAGFDQRIELGESVVAELGSWTRDHGDQLMAPLTGVVKRTARLPAGAPTVDRWALLVPRTRVSDVDDAVARLRAHSGAEVRYVGPLPPYSFLEQPAAPGHRWGW